MLRNIAAASLFTTVMAGGVNGGTDCATCTIAASIMKQDGELSRICKQGSEGEACRIVLKSIEEILRINKELSPDGVCQALDICTNESGEFCRLYPAPASAFKKRPPNAPVVGAKGGLCNSTIFKPVCNALNNFGNDHTPLEDLDHDGYSTIETFRGTSWKGKDCDEEFATVHPGAASTNNCNGINVDYYDYCPDSSPRMGFAALGDSATAHFHLPACFFTPDNLNFSLAEFAAENEFDWPQYSWGAAFKNITESMHPTIAGPVDSIYMRLKEVNRCNHRDYQNVGVNGARSTSMQKITETAFVRDAGAPRMLLTLALIGNDVCNGHPDTIAHMTTPERFVEANTATLRYLDSVVPKGSSLLSMGLVDGRVLFDNMAHRIHPMSSVDKVVTYEDVYTYLNCLQISPCTGWMNKNETLRNATTARAQQLNAAWESALPGLTFENLTAVYADYPLPEVIKEWNDKGGETWQLIEPVDGFHPSQIAHALSAEQIWKIMMKVNATHPGFLPSYNPMNSEIDRIFGDQGGY